MNAVGMSGYQVFKVCCSATQSSEHRLLPALSQPAEEVFRRYSTHVAGFIEISCRGWGVAFVLASVALDKDADDDEQEDGTESAGEGDEHDEADGHVATYTYVSRDSCG